MTRKDYKLIAGAIREVLLATKAVGTEPTDGIYAVATSIADRLATDNPRFDAHKFANAIETGKGL